MKSKIMYIENKSNGHNGLAGIGKTIVKNSLNNNS